MAEKQKGPIVPMKQVTAKAVVTVFDKNGKKKGELHFTNDPEELKHEVERRRKKRNP